MRWFRGPGRLLGASLLAVLLLPALALWPSSAIDRGPDGEARLSAFPIAIAAFDPFVWTCARNSAAVASAVAGGSLAIGVGLALLVGQRRFWGRTLVWALAMASLAAGPLVNAPGIALILGGDLRWDWLAARSMLGYSGEELVRWSALVWVGLASGVPLVAMATSGALRQVNPSWTEAARAVGASRRRIWWDLVWPILRPVSARAAAMVFTLTLVEPAGPLVLGLRRTLAVQLLGAASRLDQPTRAATLAILAVLIAAVGRVVMRWWGGLPCVRTIANNATASTSPNFRETSGRVVLLATWTLFALGPSMFLLAGVLGAGRTAAGASWTGLVGRWLDDPGCRTWAANSATTAALAIALDLAILATLCRRGAGIARVTVRLAARLLEAFPPLTLGVGAIATPWLLGVLADSTGEVPGRWVRAVTLELSPARSPGFLLVLCLAASRLPMLARAADLAGSELRPAQLDASKTMGASDGRSRRVAENRWLGGVPARPAILGLALAATNLAPALLLTPFSERRTLAPALLAMELGSDRVPTDAAGPFVAILALNLMAFAVASRARDQPLGSWFRG